jgi:GPH family glycoside/pentoside/hexuronide:cation symporter
VTDRSTGRLGWGTLAAFGTPAAAYSFYLFYAQFYFLKYATDVLLIAPAAAGALIGVGRLWDAVSDPLAGYWSDRTRTRFGRRRPWLFAGIPLMAISSVMVWSPPASLGETGTIVWLAVSLWLFYTAYTIYTVPHMSLGAELTDDFHERSRVFGAQRMAFVFGMLFAFGGIQVASNAEDERAGALMVAMVAACVATALLSTSPIFLKERPGRIGRGSDSPYGAFRDVFRNRNARVLLGAWLAEGIGGGALGVLAPFMTEYIVERSDLIGVVPAFFVIPSVLAIPVWVRLSHTYGKRTVWRMAAVGSCLFFAMTFFVGAGDLTTLCALLVGAGACFGCGGAIGQSMLADVIDWDELQSGQRKEGAYAAAWGFAIKMSVGVVIVLVGIVLQVAGFQPDVEQAASAELALRGLFAGLPVLAFGGSLLLLRWYTLDADEHARIVTELDAARQTPTS